MTRVYCPEHGTKADPECCGEPLDPVVEWLKDLGFNDDDPIMDWLTSDGVNTLDSHKSNAYRNLCEVWVRRSNGHHVKFVIPKKLCRDDGCLTVGPDADLKLGRCRVESWVAIDQNFESPVVTGGRFDSLYKDLPLATKYVFNIVWECGL